MKVAQGGDTMYEFRVLVFREFSRAFLLLAQDGFRRSGLIEKKESRESG